MDQKYAQNMWYPKYVLCHGWMFVRPGSAERVPPRVEHRMNLPHKTRRRKQAKKRKIRRVRNGRARNRRKKKREMEM